MVSEKQLGLYILNFKKILNTMQFFEHLKKSEWILWTRKFTISKSALALVILLNFDVTSIDKSFPNLFNDFISILLNLIEKSVDAKEHWRVL